MAGAAGDPNAGTRDFAFIQVMTPAKTMGLAEANTVLGEGTDAIGSNPAGLSRATSSRTLAGTLRFWTLGESGGQIAYSFGDSLSRFALGAAYMNYGEIDMLDEEARPLGIAQPSSFSPSLTYARAFSERWRLGGTLKGYQEYLGDFEGAQSAIGIGVDVGLLYNPKVRNLGFGMALLNAGRKWTAHTYDGSDAGYTPAAIRAGLYYIPPAWAKLRLASEIQIDDGDNPILSAAGEYGFSSFVQFRAGVRGNWREMKHLWTVVSEGNAGPFYGGEARRLGAGFTLNHGGLALDYGLQWWTDLGIVHGLTLKRGW